MSKRRLLLVILLFIIFPPPSTPDWTSECVSRYPASCRCTWSSGKRLADCSKSNMNVLPVLSNEIQILDMSNNKLTQLHDNGFTNANLINLQKLYLKGCRINRLHELAFYNLRILTELDLSYNEIEFVDPIMFSTNVRLSKIRLNNNKIHALREFPKLDYLSTLDFSYNVLSNLSYHTFVGLRNLKDLDLSYNQFANINPEIFPRLSSLKLRGNNWVCDCELKALRDYVVVNKFFEPELRCSEPLSLFNSQWDGFDELSCKPEILHILANGKIVDSIVALENTLVLSCVVKGDPVPDVKWVKNGRVVQEAAAQQSGVVDNIGGGVVMLNLTVGRHDNEFVCVGSNSGGVVERNLTVTLDEAGLSGFVVLKDGVEGGLGGSGGGKDRGGLLIYLVIGVVFLSLIVGLVVGGVCVWRWGQRGGGARAVAEQDSVVKGVLKDDTNEDNEGGGGDNMQVHHHHAHPQQQQQQREFLVEQSLKPHASADDLLGDSIQRQRPTPDLLINNGANSPELEELYNKFPIIQTPTQHDNSSLYDNYELVYKPLLGGGGGSSIISSSNTGPDSLRRYCISRDYNTTQRPSSVCSEPKAPIFSPVNSRNSPVILPSHHGYVTLPRRSIHHHQNNNSKKKELQFPIKYDNLGPRTTADGSSSMSLNDIGSSSDNAAAAAANNHPNHHHHHHHPTLQPPPASSNHLFEPIIEQPADEEPLLDTPVDTTPRKYRPVPPPKPKKKKLTPSNPEEQQPLAEQAQVVVPHDVENDFNNGDDDHNDVDDDDDDGTEV